MSEFQDRNGLRGSVTRLSEVMREVRIATADKSDVVIDMKEADRARLELLAAELKPVFDDVPAENDLFDFAISSGLQPRLWIDAVTHVQMGRDRRTYRFVRDTRLGRVVMGESTDMRPIADQVTRYIAERLIERQQLMDGGIESHRPAQVGKPSELAPPMAAPADAKGLETAHASESKWTNIVASLVWVLLGAVIGGGILLAILSGQMSSLFAR